MRKKEKIIKEKKEKDKTKSRSLAFNSVAIVTILIVIAVTVIFNIVISNLVNAQIDLTATKNFSMAEEAKEVLKEVTKEVEIIGLFDEIKQDIGASSASMAADPNYFTDLYFSGQLHDGAPMSAWYIYTLQNAGISLPVDSLAYMDVSSVMGTLNQFTQLNSKIKVSYVDPEANPLFLKNYLGNSAKANEFEKGDFIVKCGNVFKRVTSADLCRTIIESSSGTKIYIPYAPNVDGGFLSAILYVTADKRPVVGFAANHSEYDPEKYSPLLKDTLEDNAFIVETMDLTVDDMSKYDIIFLLNPLTDITVGESDNLRSYLSGGGNLIVASGPSSKSPEFTNLNKVLESFNLKINNDLVEGGSDEATQYGLYLPVITSSELLSDVITSSSKVLVPTARSITPLSKSSDELTSNIVIQTGKSAITNDYTTSEKTAAGSKCIAAVSAYTGTEGSKVLVLGSADMLSSDLSFTAAQSVEMVVRICAWMEQSVNFRIPVKNVEAPVITVSESSAALIGWMVILLLPVLVMGIGVFIWLRRRHL